MEPQTPAHPAAPAPAPATDRGRTPPVPELIVELRDLVITYVKQQTLVPLRDLGRYVAFGIVGSVLLGVGVTLLGMSGLRALQTETGETFTGDWSWVPYLITIAGLIVGGAIVWLLRSTSKMERKA